MKYVLGSHAEGCAHFDHVMVVGRKREVMRQAKRLREFQADQIIDIGRLVKGGIVLIGVHDNIIERFVNARTAFSWKSWNVPIGQKERLYLCYKKPVNRKYYGEIVDGRFKHEQ